jgi:hypothetical protein
MAYPHSLEPLLSTAELRLLGYLHQKWPSSSTVTPRTTSLAGGDQSNAAFVDMVQTLNDNGLISYEAFLIDATSGLRFIETVITPRGKATLRSAELYAL